MQNFADEFLLRSLNLHLKRVIGGVFGRRLENPLFLFLATGGASFSDPELSQILKVTCLVNLLGLIGFGGGSLEVDGSEVDFFVNRLIGGF